MSSTLMPVAAVRPVAPYVGGKRVLSPVLCQIIAQIPHRAYLEPFVGMGGVFFRRTRKPPVEVINDASRDVWTLFKVLEVHHAAFVEMLRYQITSREEFERLVAVDPTTLTDLQRAARFLYLQRVAFGGKVSGRNFGVDRNAGGAFDLTKIVPLLAEVHHRLAGVTIERLDFEAFIDRYDSDKALAYIDPPYWGTEGYYGADLFGRADFNRLESALRRMRGAFVLSINAHPDVRTLFDGFEIHEVGVSYGVGGGAVQARELIISNRRIELAR